MQLTFVILIHTDIIIYKILMKCVVITMQILFKGNIYDLSIHYLLNILLSSDILSFKKE